MMLQMKIDSPCRKFAISSAKANPISCIIIYADIVIVNCFSIFAYQRDTFIFMDIFIMKLDNYLLQAMDKHKNMKPKRRRASDQMHRPLDVE